MFNNSNKTTKHSVNKCSVLFNKFRKCLVRTASIITCTAIVATSVTPAFAAGITSGTTAASSYVISNGTTAAKSSVISTRYQQTLLFRGHRLRILPVRVQY